MEISLQPARSVIPVKIYESERKAAIWEQALLAVWFFAVSLPVLELGPIRFVCIAAILSVFAWHFRETMPMLLRSWPLLIVPVMGLLSIFWTGYPGKAIPIAILLLLTPILLVTIASRLRPAEFFRVMMLGGTLAVLYCIPYIPTLPEGGPYDQKNVLAYQMMLVTLVSFTTFLNTNEHTIVRLIALATTVVAFSFQLIADSATSLVLALLGGTFLIAVKTFWVPAEKVADLRFVIFSVALILILLVALVVSMMPQITLLSDFLNLVGKDSTLTGRTDIWIGAEMAAAERPWTGLGLAGFWQPDTGLAVTLNELTHTPPGLPISFHSAFWEIRVHLGFIGLGFMIFAIAWSGFRTVRLWLQEGSLANSALMLFFFIILVSSFTESYAALSFSPIVALLYFGGLAAFRSGERKFIGSGNLVETDA
ncbi:MAG: hypothetical protein VR74_17695 [Hyphomonas sp. BRH_c22]|uniref:O-antigen ligase family protein n=1 Tax=Hyphomonas sp. BRH_c22 TaxID=1629710 RepID=UPI0005F0F949|nr:O-antigen ligase family protein [Hyphomonas sp. BRH_c22]KJS35189.1 MAG: hypothetical protein VR74_17695 [Hyphomonas sp. BRH_c22]